MRSIHVTTAKNLLNDVARLRPAAVLSIEHPGATDETGRAPRLDAGGLVQHVQTYWDTEQDGLEGGPTGSLIAQGLVFLQRQAAHGPLIVHCRAGKARSPAMALAYLVAANPQHPLSECITHLKSIRPEAAPNILVVALADWQMKLGGTLLRAVERDADFTRNRLLANAARARWAEKNPPLKTAPLALPGNVARPS